MKACFTVYENSYFSEGKCKIRLVFFNKCAAFLWTSHSCITIKHKSHMMLILCDFYGSQNLTNWPFNVRVFSTKRSFWRNGIRRNDIQRNVIWRIGFRRSVRFPFMKLDSIFFTFWSLSGVACCTLVVPTLGWPSPGVPWKYYRVLEKISLKVMKTRQYKNWII